MFFNLCIVQHVSESDKNASGVGKNRVTNRNPRVMNPFDLATILVGAASTLRDNYMFGLVLVSI